MSKYYTSWDPAQLRIKEKKVLAGCLPAQAPNPSDLCLPSEPQAGGPRISKAGASPARRKRRKGKKDKWKKKGENEPLLGLSDLLNMTSRRRCRILFQAPSPTLLTPESFVVLVDPGLEALACCREAPKARAGPRAVAVGGGQAEETTRL